MMMSPTALIDTAGSGALPGAPGEVDNGAPDGGGGVCPVAADVPLCPPAVVHAAGSNIRVSSADTRRQRGGRLAGAGRRAASMLVLWAWPRVARHGSGQNMRPVLLPAPTPLRHPDCPSTAAGAQRPSATKHSRRPFQRPHRTHNQKRLDAAHKLESDKHSLPQNGGFGDALLIVLCNCYL